MLCLAACCPLTAALPPYHDEFIPLKL
ncbi:rCG41976 [Rattus norvegicus]|uniref:RCG41976 n=1 Tax=Rattus norvegicus TaxID=10116 RepID=A6JUY6_RAT|nr:rCG41976 [Rattus norvegicus]